MENEVILKRAIFGGFDRRQVMRYIEYLHFQSGSANERIKELEEIKLKVERLEAELKEKDDTIERLSAEISEVENDARLGRASAALVRESVAYADSYVESAKMLARDISDKAYSSAEDAKGKVDGVMKSLNEISDSVLGLYKLMENLKKEYDSLGEICAETENVEVSEQTKPAAKNKKTDSLPSEEDMTDFLSRMKSKYKNMLSE